MSKTAESKPRNRDKRMIYAAAAVIIVLIPTVYFYYASQARPSSPKAAIVDQLGSSKLADAIRHINQSFVETVEQLLLERFSTVDYYLDNATVEQYKHLASRGYKFIVWRAHSALDLDSKFVALSTTDKQGLIDYGGYFMNDQLTLCNITGDPDLYYGITPEFISEVMDGRFQDTVIFLMSCNGLNEEYLKTAQSLEQKGALAVISWDNWVSSADNDYAANLVLRYLLKENNTIGEAAGKILVTLSDYGWTRLTFNPPESANYRIPDYREKAAAQGTALVCQSMVRQQESTEHSALKMRSAQLIHQPFDAS